MMASSSDSMPAFTVDRTYSTITAAAETARWTQTPRRSVARDASVSNIARHLVARRMPPQKMIQQQHHATRMNQLPLVTRQSSALSSIYAMMTKMPKKNSSSYKTTTVATIAIPKIRTRRAPIIITPTKVAAAMPSKTQRRKPPPIESKLNLNPTQPHSSTFYPRDLIGTLKVSHGDCARMGWRCVVLNHLHERSSGGESVTNLPCHRAQKLTRRGGKSEKRGRELVLHIVGTSVDSKLCGTGKKATTK